MPDSGSCLPSRVASMRSYRGASIDALLGPAEAQYGQVIDLEIVGAQGPLGCNVTIVDDDPNDIIVGGGTLRADISWSDIAGETGYRLQFDLQSTSFVTEDQGFEEPPDTVSSFTSSNLFPGDSRPETIRVFGHVGHAPNHGPTPIAGDVVSNECTLTFEVPEEEPPT